jgi:hypothetical protein
VSTFLISEALIGCGLAVIAFKIYRLIAETI